MGIKNHTRDTGWNTRIQATPKTWVLKIIPVKRGKMHKRKQAPPNVGTKITPTTRREIYNHKQTVQITRVLKITPLLRGGIYKHKQTVQITRVLKITPVIRDGIREYEQPQKMWVQKIIPATRGEMYKRKQVPKT